jgi:hypothetical protein
MQLFNNPRPAAPNMPQQQMSCPLQFFFHSICSTFWSSCRSIVRLSACEPEGLEEWQACFLAWQVRSEMCQSKAAQQPCRPKKKPSTDIQLMNWSQCELVCDAIWLEFLDWGVPNQQFGACYRGQQGYIL